MKAVVQRFLSRVPASVLARHVSVASTPPPPSPPPGDQVSPLHTFQNFSRSFWPKFEAWMASYEEFIGIKQVKEAHARVLQAETDFMKAQEDRREAQLLMNTIQVRLREVRAELDRTPRGEHNYLDIIKKEIELIREERTLRDTFEREEKRERELFNNLSSALRFSHEKERAQTEKTKYWSIMASLIGAFLGIVGTTINSQLKLRKLHQLMTENTNASAEAVILKLEQISTKVKVDPLLLTELEDIKKSISFDPNAKVPLLIKHLDKSFDKSEENRRAELVIATGCILILVPILVRLFST